VVWRHGPTALYAGPRGIALSPRPSRRRRWTGRADPVVGTGELREHGQVVQRQPDTQTRSAPLSQQLLAAPLAVRALVWSSRDIRSSVEVVSTAYEDVPFSELLHHPAATTRRLDAVRALRLRRRDAGDLALIRADQLERDTTVVDFTARLLAGLVRTENVAALRQALPEALPWSAFLPPDDVDVLITELVGIARGAVALENLNPIALLLAQWRHTAEIYADPALLAVLTREPDGDLGPVPVPSKSRVTPKRGDRAAPPPVDDEYDIRFANVVDDGNRTVWITYAGTSHPKITECR
jgi:hypothetical protein